MDATELERLNRLEEAFHTALGCSEGEERDLFLAAIEATDPEIMCELRQLIAADLRIVVTPGSNGDPLPRFGAWQALRVLGRGGMGTVYLAERADGAFKMRAAVKVVPLALASSELEDRFRRERQILAMLDHPRIARLLDGGVSEWGVPYLVMEFVNGERIDAYAKAHRLDTRARLQLMVQVFTALEYVHSQHVLHRDLKPSNVLIDAAGRVKLVDFGIARLMESEPGDFFTRSGLFTFTPDYASPEQIRGERLSAASDVYSAGVLLAKVLTDKLPGESDLARDLGADLSAVVSKALRKDPASRYANAAEMLADLERVLAGKAPNVRSRRRAVFSIAGALLVAVFAALCWFAFGSRSDQEALAPLNAASPVLSADARWVAYVWQSHIWISPAASVTRKQVTFLPGRDAHPSLSADGRLLIYEHHAPGGTPAVLYKAALHNGALAGTETILWPGQHPSISPDSQKVAFETLSFSGADDTAPRQIEVASLAGASAHHAKIKQPRRLAGWIWKADSTGLLAMGHRSIFTAEDQNRLEFYDLDLHDGAPKPVAYWPAEYGNPGLCGMAGDNRVAAIGTLGTDLQWLEFTPSLNGFHVVRTQLPRIVSCQLVSGDRLALAIDRTQRSIWRLPGDVADGRFQPNAADSTQIALEDALSASTDGKWLTWSDGRRSFLRGPSGESSVVSPVALAASVSPDGSSLSYLDSSIKDHYHLVSLPSGHEVRTFEIDSIIWSLSKNGERALTVGVPSTPRTIAVMDTRTQLVRTVLADPTRNLYLASFSPDEQWILFTAESVNSQPTMYIARYDSSRLLAPSEWIELGRGDYPRWGTTNDRIYFLSANGALATAALNARTKTVLPASRRVIYSAGAPWDTAALIPGTFRIAVTKDALYFPLANRNSSAVILHH